MEQHRNQELQWKSNYVPMSTGQAILVGVCLWVVAVWTACALWDSVVTLSAKLP